MRTSLVLSLHALRSMYDGYRNRIIWIITLHVSHTQWYNHLLLLLLLCHLIQCQRGSGRLQVMRSFTFSPHLLLHRTLRINTSPRSYRRHQSLLVLLQRLLPTHCSGRSRRAHIAGNTSFHLFLLHILHVILSILSHRHCSHFPLLLHLLLVLLLLSLHGRLLLLQRGSGCQHVVRNSPSLPFLLPLRRSRRHYWFWIDFRLLRWRQASFG